MTTATPRRDKRSAYIPGLLIVVVLLGGLGFKVYSDDRKPAYTLTDFCGDFGLAVGLYRAGVQVGQAFIETVQGDAAKVGGEPGSTVQQEATELGIAIEDGDQTDATEYENLIKTHCLANGTPVNTSPYVTLRASRPGAETA